MISRTDLDATLRALLIHFRASDDQGASAIARLAQAGAEAILTQTRLESWLDSAGCADLLGITTDGLLKRVKRATPGGPRFCWAAALPPARREPRVAEPAARRHRAVGVATHIIRHV
jgi:hypothetical protein